MLLFPSVDVFDVVIVVVVVVPSFESAVVIGIVIFAIVIIIAVAFIAVVIVFDAAAVVAYIKYDRNDYRYDGAVESVDRSRERALSGQGMDVLPLLRPRYQRRRQRR